MEERRSGRKYRGEGQNIDVVENEEKIRFWFERYQCEERERYTWELREKREN